MFFGADYITETINFNYLKLKYLPSGGLGHCWMEHAIFSRILLQNMSHTSMAK